MEQEVGNFHLVNRIKDTNFSIDDLTHYNLSLLVGRNDFQFCVIDTRENKCLLLEDYELEGIHSTNVLINTLYKLFEGHHLLMAGYWKSVKLAMKNQKFTMIPSHLFSHEHLRDYLKLSTEVDSELDDFYYYQHTHSEAVCVFAAERKIIEKVRSIYPTLTVQVVHHASAFIEGIQSHRDFTYYKDLYINIGRNNFSLVVTEDNKLLLYNRFPYQKSEDIVKYTMLTMQEMNMSQQDTKTIVWGNISADSLHFKELYRYIKNISFGARPSYLNFAYMFDEVADHQYFDLYSIYVCE
ncbi:hypothetical protein OKW21_005697 [Catalinimonas alkaloidigena]|uniref:DUF3822 family protein n=1 Tax=Catalinimonas alkaloidigena TaxID=1075417 RepID=UPI00240643EA|nr:DUF3822 family protein [Catalinimonas alkaloidigena]MDF9800434.1 hypothetical protein [Catalinimonas alkaloidigena]